MDDLEKGIYYSPDRIVEMILDGKTFPKENIYNVISNPQRVKIIKFCAKEKKSIKQIQEYLDLSYNPTWKHVQQLLEKGLVEGEAGVDKKGAVMYIKTITPQPPLHGKRIK